MPAIIASCAPPRFPVFAEVCFPISICTPQFPFAMGVNALITSLTRAALHKFTTKLRFSEIRSVTQLRLSMCKEAVAFISASRPLVMRAQFCLVELVFGRYGHHHHEMKKHEAVLAATKHSPGKPAQFAQSHKLYAHFT